MKIISILTLLIISILSFGQITISEEDFPAEPLSYKLFKAKTTNFKIPVEGTGENWDYRTLTYLDEDSFHFEEPNNPAFPLTALVRKNIFQEVASGMGYYYDKYYVENDQYFGIEGIHVNGKAYDISSVTFSKGDSLIFPNIDYKYDEAIELINYPLTYGTNWTVNYTEKGDFELTVKFYGLNKSKGLSVRHVKTDYEVVGWGYLILPYDTTYSQEYEVLMLKSQSLSVDSMYLDGQPASPLLMAAFGMKQGEQKVTNTYTFLTKGRFQPLMLIDFGSNSFKTPELIQYDPSVEMTSLKYVFSNNLKIYPSIVKDNIFIKNAENCIFTLLNLQGQQLISKQITENQEQVSLHNLEKGVYFVNIQKKGINRSYKLVKE